jgi:hypothetical protein
VPETFLFFSFLVSFFVSRLEKVKMEELGSMWGFEEVGSFCSLFPLLGLAWSGI